MNVSLRNKFRLYLARKKHYRTLTKPYKEKLDTIILILPLVIFYVCICKIMTYVTINLCKKL